MNRHTIRLVLPILFLGLTSFPGAYRDALAQTAIKLDPAVVETWTDMKKNADPQFMALKLSDDSRSIILDETWKSSVSYDDFVASFPDNAFRYYLFFIHYTRADGALKKKAVLIQWKIDTINSLRAMRLSASRPDLLDTLGNVDVVIEATAKDQITHDAVLAKVSQ